MQNKIRILPTHITNKIAAGEVVQRPESVVKELMENAIDAKAQNIDVIIKAAGKSLIQVVDDGDGMSEEDAVMSIQRHSTSKIEEFEDLEKLNTFGFRGEALASIAAVSKLEIKTEQKDDDIGTLIRAEDENEITEEKGSFAKGTSIAVKNLFYNTPARRNFLKTNSTELKHNTETFKKISLSNPKVSFKLYNENDLTLDYSAADFPERVRQIFGANITDSLIEVGESTDYIDIKGYAAKPNYLKKSKGEQYVFINNRFVNSKLINHAVFTAYENILEKGEYPFFILFLTINPAVMDINVHPSKLEVKFEDEKIVYSLINSVVKKSIGSHDLVPSMSFGETDSTEKLRFNNYRKVKKNDFSDRPDFKGDRHNQDNRQPIFSDEEIDLVFSSLNKEVKQNAPEGQVESPFEQSRPKEVYHQSTERQSTESSKAGTNSTFIVSLHNKYILSQIKSGLMIIDQHVAHERILYEKILRSFEADMPVSQQLLFPQSVEIDPGDYELLKEIKEYINKIGFEVLLKPKNRIEIVGVPGDVKSGYEVEILKEVLDEYSKNLQEKQLDTKDNLAKSFSCKAAIKAGEQLSESEMRLLVDQLFATSMPYVCPHGRPIVIKIPLDELDKRFGRT